jgi:hypothetical protein
MRVIKNVYQPHACVEKDEGGKSLVCLKRLFVERAEVRNKD